MIMWKQFNDAYLVSELGEVKNIKTGYILKGDLNSKGYKRVILNGKKYFVHRLVATLFIPNPENLKQVNHINHDKLDNRVVNLEWCNNQYNNQVAYSNGRISGKTKISKEELITIINYIKTKQYKIKEIASLYNVSIPTIYAIKQGLNIKRLTL